MYFMHICYTRRNIFHIEILVSKSSSFSFEEVTYDNLKLTNQVQLQLMKCVSF